jgi:hypothetical protein
MVISFAYCNTQIGMPQWPAILKQFGEINIQSESNTHKNRYDMTRWGIRYKVQTKQIDWSHRWGQYGSRCFSVSDLES